MFGQQFFNAQNKSLLLDEVKALSFLAAWSSARRLTQNYTSNIIEVRRSNDNTAQNIGYSGEAVDLAAISSFVSSNSGFFRTVYDQTGNGRHIVQTTAANQPRARNSGTNDLMGTRLTIQGTGASFIGLANSNLVTGTALTLITVISVGTTNLNHNRWVSAWKNTDGLDYAATGLRLSSGGANNSVTATINAIGTIQALAAGNAVLTLIRNGANITVRINGTTVYTATTGSGNFQIDNIRFLAEGNYAGPGNYSSQKVSESVLTSSALSIANCQLLERNMGQFYGIAVT